MPHLPRRLCLIIALAVSPSLAACGGSAGGATNQPSSSATPSATAPSGAAATAGLQGAPIIVADNTQINGIPGIDFSPMPDGAKAAAAYVNSQGGVDGRPIEVVSCNTRYDPNGSKACAAAAVAQHPFAITGLDDLSTTSGADALYAKSGIILTMDAPNQTTLVHRSQRIWCRQRWRWRVLWPRRLTSARS